MHKFNICLTGMLYEVKRHYPIFTQLERGMCDVEKELNKGIICKEEKCENRKCKGR